MCGNATCNNITTAYNNSTPQPNVVLPVDESDTHAMLTGTLLIVAYTIVFLLGVGGNGLVLHFYWQKTRRSLFDLYVIHLAFADLLSSFVTPIFFVHQEVTKDTPQSRMPAAACISISVVTPITVNVSSWILTSIAHERYRGIVQPFKTRYSRNRIHLQVAIIWLLTLSLFIPYIMAIDTTNGSCRPLWASYKSEFAYNVAILLLQSVLPISLMAYWFIAIASVLNGPERKKLFSSADSTKCPSRASKRAKKLTSLLLVAVIVFTICSLPYNIFYALAIYLVFFVGVSVSTLKTILAVNPWLSALTVSSCITNALVYGGMHTEFRQFLRTRLSTLSIRRRDSIVTSSSSEAPMHTTGLSTKSHLTNETHL